MKEIFLEPTTHRGEQRIKFLLSKDVWLSDNMLYLPDMQFSASMLCWHFLASDNYREILKNILNGNYAFIERLPNNETLTSIPKANYQSITRDIDNEIKAKDKKRKAKAELLINQNENTIEIQTNNTSKLTDILNSFKECQWISEKRIWILPNNEKTINQLRQLLYFNSIQYQIKNSTNLTIINPEQHKRQSVPKRIPLNFLEIMNYKGYSEKTISLYAAQIDHFLDYFKDQDISKLSNEQISKYLHELLESYHYSKSFRNQIINSIRKFLEFQYNRHIDNSFIPKSSMDASLPNTLSLNEIRSIIIATKNPKHRTIMTVIYSTGIRLSEATNIMLEDIDLVRKIILIKKGKKERIIPMSILLHKQLINYITTYTPCQYLFEGWHGKKYSNRSVQKILKASIELAGIDKRITINTLRHSFASHLLQQGTDIRIIQEILGHESHRTTEVYAKISKANIGNIQNPIDFMDLN